MCLYETKIEIKIHRVFEELCSQVPDLAHLSEENKTRLRRIIVGKYQHLHNVMRGKIFVEEVVELQRAKQYETLISLFGNVLANGMMDVRYALLISLLSISIGHACFLEGDYFTGEHAIDEIAYRSIFSIVTEDAIQAICNELPKLKRQANNGNNRNSAIWNIFTLFHEKDQEEGVEETDYFNTISDRFTVLFAEKQDSLADFKCSQWPGYIGTNYFVYSGVLLFAAVMSAYVSDAANFGWFGFGLSLTVVFALIFWLDKKYHVPVMSKREHTENGSEHGQTSRLRL